MSYNDITDVMIYWFQILPLTNLDNDRLKLCQCRSQWPRGLRRRTAPARLLRSWVRISQGACKFVCCECCVLSGRGLCDELITRPEESYRLWCVVVCNPETQWKRRPWPALGRRPIGKQNRESVKEKRFVCQEAVIEWFVGKSQICLVRIRKRKKIIRQSSVSAS